MTKISEVINVLEKFAPPVFQESYDNCGLLVGDKNAVVNGVLLTLDVIEETIDEAIKNNCNLIVAHHPLIFSGLKKITGANLIQRCVIKAIKNDIAIYAAHTNFDNVNNGVNAKICDLLQLKNQKVLVPKTNTLSKLVTYAPLADADKVRNALFEAGAGNIGNYSNCSFNSNGTGTFMANNGANPFVGELNKLHSEAETKIEVVFPNHLRNQIISKLKQNHPYEEVAYETVAIDNVWTDLGSGRIGELEVEENELDFLNTIKQVFDAKSLRYTKLLNKKVKKVAVCGGSGSFLLNDAINAGADIFLSSDFKYHQFFDAENRIVIADIGHYEGEQYTKQLFSEIINKNFTTFAVRLTEINTNPINYL
ncbi:MAG: Nif3-like dinuclear metal center hexameric protein [Bacteroidota bacterium]